MGKPISVIIPLAPGEQIWRELVGTLELPRSSEIILATGNQNISTSDLTLPEGIGLRTVNGGQGRAGQMNAGARAAKHDWIWFLHADSRLTENTLEAVEHVVRTGEMALFFFALRFLGDGPRLMKLNEWAVGLRSSLLKMPFGDQGFLIQKKLFEDLGGYREDVFYGEDHVFVWKTRQEGYGVNRARGDLLTSARKYRESGWLLTTSRHVWLTICQAVPNCFQLILRRLERLSK